MNKIILASSIVFCLLATQVEAKKKLYKWVDENGNVSYSDQVPPEQIKKQHEELNKQGVVLEKIDDIKTPEELQVEREALLQKIAAEEEAAKQEETRQNIIKSYTNEAEIIRLKDERLSSLIRNIEQAKQSLTFQYKSREELLSRAADNERDGQEISKALKSRIQIVEDKIQHQKEFITIKTTEIGVVKAKFAKDLSIYRAAAMHGG
ncbi:MAG: DUF4124 domain-containing protein [Proteobacteria bacterium]|nr:DUF4124 domain-containing protein [Pseudomonadota bacterium]